MEGNNDNYEIFRDCVSATVLANSTRPTKQPKKRVAGGLGGSAALSRSRDEAPSNFSAGEDDPAELAEFIEVASNAANAAECRT
jgi:hypothetical protein